MLSFELSVLSASALLSFAQVPPDLGAYGLALETVHLYYYEWPSSAGVPSLTTRAIL